MDGLHRVEYIIQLISGFREGTLSEIEQTELENWLAAHQENRIFFDRYLDDAERRKAVTRMSLHNAEAAFQRVQSKLSNRWRTSNKVLLIAASMLIVITVALYFYPLLFGTQQLDVLDQQIGPGGNKAILTLVDGTKINLDSTKVGIRINEDHILYDDGNRISGVMLNSDKVGKRSLPSSLTLSTPRGGQYQIILSDGTKVWLNAASTLKYPSRFSEDNREVSLDGEGYFEIAENKYKPFKVLSKNQVVEVLGTSFNINSYESSVKTTLVTGSVKIIASSNNGPGLLLVPSEQSILFNNRLVKQKINLSEEISWRRGEFSFEGKNLEQVMRELSRWYNFEVKYEGSIPNVEFFGGLYRDDQMSTVLRLLETNGIRYRLENRTVTITGKNAKQ